MRNPCDFKVVQDDHPTMASEDSKPPFQGAALQQITQIVKSILQSSRSESEHSSERRSHHALAPPRSGSASFSSTAIYTSRKSHPVLSPEWYRELRPLLIRSTFMTPPSSHMPDFFRIVDNQHNGLYSCNVMTSDARSEADALYQIQAFLHENLNRQISLIDEICAVDVSDVLVDALEDNWRHLYGISEMIQARYDILGGKRAGDQEQTRLLDLCTRPPVGNGSFARTINRNLRKLWTDDVPNGIETDVMREMTDSEDLTRDEDFGSSPRENFGPDMAITRDKFGSATTWDRVAKAASKETKGRTQIDEGSFVYVMRCHDLVKERAIYSPWYYLGGFRWRLLLFPQADRRFDDLMNMYLMCGGPSDKTRAEDDSRTNASANSVKDKSGRDEWFCAVEFSMRLLHPTSPIAKEGFRRDLGDFFDPSAPEESSSEESESGVYPDLVEEYSHVFRESSDDWGGGIAPFSMLQPGKYSDKNMNLAFLINIRLQSKSLFNGVKMTEVSSERGVSEGSVKQTDVKYLRNPPSRRILRTPSNAFAHRSQLT